MKKLKKSIISFFILMNSVVWANTPDPKLVNTTGGTLKNNNTIIEYSIGEIAITTLSGINGGVTQGYLQPINNLLAALPNIIMGNNILLFPNPTQNILYLSSTNEDIKLVNIYTMDGQKIISFENPEKSFSLENLAKGVYQVELIGNRNQILTNTKIVKQ